MLPKQRARDSDLDPGIRRVVMWIRGLGLHTTDSGDGVSKPADARVTDVPHVAIASRKASFFGDVDRLSALVDAFGIDPGPWDQDTEPCPPGLVQVSGQYSSGICLIMVSGLHEGNLPAGLGE